MTKYKYLTRGDKHVVEKKPDKHVQKEESKGAEVKQILESQRCTYAHDYTLGHGLKKH